MVDTELQTLVTGRPPLDTGRLRPDTVHPRQDTTPELIWWAVWPTSIVDADMENLTQSGPFQLNLTQFDLYHPRLSWAPNRRRSTPSWPNCKSSSDQFRTPSSSWGSTLSTRWNKKFKRRPIFNEMSTRRAHLTLHLGLDRSDTTTETEAELAEQAEPAELATLMPPILSFKYLSVSYL